MRALGIDHGEARIGLALSDEIGMLAHPLETVPARGPKKPTERIQEVIDEFGVTTVVIGFPLKLDGTEGAAVEKVRGFIKKLRKTIGESMPIVTIDERLSTVEAQRSLHAVGKTVKSSRPIIDQAAACVILQDYLDQQRGPDAVLLPDPGDGESCD